MPRIAGAVFVPWFSPLTAGGRAGAVAAAAAGRLAAGDHALYEGSRAPDPGGYGQAGNIHRQGEPELFFYPRHAGEGRGKQNSQ